MEEYEKQANDFLKLTKTSLNVEFIKHDKHFTDDEETRDIYLFTFTRGNREFKGNFGQSIMESGFTLINTNTNEEIRYRWLSEAMRYAQGDEQKFKQFVRNKLTLNCIIIKNKMKTPTAYDILACLQTYEVENFKDFCSDYGYSEDSIKAHKIYDAVLEEWGNVERMWSDEEIEKINEIL